VYNVGFDFGPATPATGVTVYFTGTAAGSSPISYTWNFGDGSGETAPSTSVFATHSFNSAMTYTVEMTATNACSGDGVTVSSQVPVYQTDHDVYLPVVLRSYVSN
jgi:PKD repeat protein